MKKIILKLLPWIITLLIIAALVVFVGIPIYSNSDENQVEAPTVYNYEGDTAPIVMENDQLTFTMDPATTQFQVTEKGSGRVWRSNPEGAASDPIAIARNKEMMQSTATVTYTTSGGTTELNNFKYSIENGNFDINWQEDGSLCVDYAIGKIEKTFLIPTAITEERYYEETGCFASGCLDALRELLGAGRSSRRLPRSEGRHRLRRCFHRHLHLVRFSPCG